MCEIINLAEDKKPRIDVDLIIESLCDDLELPPDMDLSDYRESIEKEIVSWV